MAGRISPHDRFLSERRYALVPQMRDYDGLEAKQWLPYVMTFQRPGISTPSFTTDEYGFRSTMWRDRRLTLAQHMSLEGRHGVVVGGSTAFGVGASADAYTLASLLNERTDQVWFNFAGRSFNSTQELLIFLLYLPPSVDTVLILSGINNLVLSFLSSATSPVYNSFYAQSVFERGLRSGQVTGVRGTLKLLVRELADLAARDQSEARDGAGEKYEHVKACFRRDMRLWALLRQAMGYRLYFVFQPITSWIGKALSEEERELFDILDRIDPYGSWQQLASFLRDMAARYVADVREACDELDIPFLDLNRSAALRDGRWLFVDRAHLTDDGYVAVADDIVKEWRL